MKIRGDWNAKSLKFYYTNFKSWYNKSSRIFGSERTQFWNLLSHNVHLKRMKIRGDRNAKSLRFYYTLFFFLDCFCRYPAKAWPLWFCSLFFFSHGNRLRFEAKSFEKSVSQEAPCSLGVLWFARRVPGVPDGLRESEGQALTVALIGSIFPGFDTHPIFFVSCNFSSPSP